jgi:SWI/SNF-related matrix-associated actin-dependent regulator 1 of chromatin subfamily A
MREFYKEDNEYYFRMEYNPKIISEIKRLEGRRYDPNSKEWIVPFSILNSNQIKYIIKEYGFKAKNVSNDEIKHQNGTIMPISKNKPLNVPKIDFSNIDLKLTPRSYQLSGIRYNLTKKNVINGSDMGTGKTAMTLLSIAKENIYPHLIITPSSVKYNWKKEFEKWLTSPPSIEVIDSNKIEEGKDVYIVNYDRIRIAEQFLSEIEWKGITCDESHNLKNSKSLRSKSLRKIINKSNPEYKFFLSGTSVMNRPVELVNPLILLGQFNSIFGNWMRFIKRYCNATKGRYGWDVKGASNLNELYQKLTDNCYFRVEKRDVLKDLPPIQEQVIYVDISDKKEYLRAENNLVDYLREKKGEEAAQKAEMAEHLVLLNTLRQLSVKFKMKNIFEWIDDFLESTDEKLIVFGVFKEGLQEIGKKYKVDVIDGSINAKNKQKAIDKFATSKDRLLVGNINSLGTGTDGLQESCSSMLIIDLPWRPTDIDQTISRLERDGQKNNIDVFYALCEETIDMYMWKVIEEKRKVANAVNKGEDVSTSERSVVGMVLKEYLERF